MRARTSPSKRENRRSSVRTFARAQAGAVHDACALDDARQRSAEVGLERRGHLRAIAAAYEASAAAQLGRA